MAFISALLPFDIFFFHQVAGGITYQYKIKDTIIKECDEEASIPYELASKVSER